jgi:hypothetical protein
MIKNGGAVPTLPHTSWKRDAELAKRMDNFSCYLILGPTLMMHGNLLSLFWVRGLLNETVSN